MSVKIKICMGTHCTMMGNLNLQEDLENLQVQYPGKIEVEAVKCLKFCEEAGAPVVEINGEFIKNATSEIIISKILEVI